MKTFELFFKEKEDKHDGVVAQKVYSENADEKVRFFVHNLCECPEDAIIGRELFDASDFIEAVELGFRIAKKGYDDIVVKQMPWES